MTPEERQSRITKLAEQGDAISKGTARLAEDVQIIALHRSNSSPPAISERLDVPVNRVLQVLGHPLK